MFGFTYPWCFYNTNALNWFIFWFVFTRALQIIYLLILSDLDGITVVVSLYIYSNKRSLVGTQRCCFYRIHSQVTKICCDIVALFFFFQILRFFFEVFSATTKCNYRRAKNTTLILTYILPLVHCFLVFALLCWG